jgi:hypothetical protein
MVIQVVFAERRGFGLKDDELAFANLLGRSSIGGYALAVRYWTCTEQRNWHYNCYGFSVVGWH